MVCDKSREDQLVFRFKSIYANTLADETTVYPGVADTLARLRADGHCLGVCTNKDEVFARSILAKLGLESFFVTVAGPDTFGFVKPDPRHLTSTIRVIDPVRPAIFVGDSEVDAQTAIAAKVPVIILTHGYCKQPHANLGADRLADRFAELPDAVRELMMSAQKIA
jgi:phosphoglycolate phosphatase